MRDLVGVARVSYGAAFTRAAMSAVKRLAMEIKEAGTISGLKEAMSSQEMAALVKQRREPD